MAVSGCAGSSRTDADFRLKAANTAETAASAVSTARIAVQAAGEGRVSGPYVSVLLGEAESDLLAAQSTFESRQPPGASADTVRERLGALLDEAADTLAEVRVEARRGEVRGLADHTGDLRETVDRLEGLEEELSS
ncbi:hypothetical protein [Streptomyces sp. AM 2-1-1]|uniref:hypothetical protein n=1 Tax=Streptomyces sp. AM 2-1-1 TaxID=3028709 RepID=UPI0023B92463|nr:hypothetical protein [Streptomyces sp. AM 2-1-1]WEH38345.1 hypothetical protein PZB77_01805 [Streptomyces sp. AM 2-1-1]